MKDPAYEGFLSVLKEYSELVTQLVAQIDVRIERGSVPNKELMETLQDSLNRMQGNVSVLKDEVNAKGQ